jgi:hypothetical protein
MAESSFQIITGNGATASVVAFALTNATNFIMQSIPTDTSGTATWGTAGSPNANIMTIQGTASGSPVPSSLNQISGSAITLGQLTMASSFPVVIASNQSNLTTVIGAAIPVGSNAIGTVTALQGAAPWSFNLTQVGGSTVILGSAVAASSIPVVFATNQTALPVTGTVSVSGLISTAATLATGIISTSGTPAAVTVKTSSGTLYGLNLFCQQTSYPVFFKIYNVTAAAVNSSVVPQMIVGISPGSPNNLPINSNGIALGGSGISYLVTKFVQLTDTTAVAQYDLVGGLAYI